MKKVTEWVLDERMCLFEGGQFCRFLCGPNTYSGYHCGFFTYPNRVAKISLVSESHFPCPDKVYRCEECLEKVKKIKVTVELL